MRKRRDFRAQNNSISSTSEKHAAHSSASWRKGQSTTIQQPHCSSLSACRHRASLDPHLLSHQSPGGGGRRWKHPPLGWKARGHFTKSYMGTKEAFPMCLLLPFVMRFCKIEAFLCHFSLLPLHKKPQLSGWAGELSIPKDIPTNKGKALI